MLVIDDKDLALLVLEDGEAFVGCSIGKGGIAYGEIVFNTAMTGYQETLTDPSYFGQIVVQTMPHIGNTGVNREDNESSRIWVNGYVVRELSPVASSWRADDLLVTQLVNDSIVGIAGVDTRYLTRKLRSAGVMKAGIFHYNNLKELAELTIGTNVAIGDRISAPEQLQNLVKQSPDMSGSHSVSVVTTQEEVTVKPVGQLLNGLKSLRVVALDLGIKSMTNQLLSQRGVEVIQLPLNTTFQRIQELAPDGVFFSNGPGDPSSAVHEIELLQQVLLAKYPFFGICMGNQMLGRTLGFETYKLKFGHRGINQPVKDLKTGRVEITAHNHGFAVNIPVGELDEFGNATTPPIVQAPHNNGQFGRVQVSHIGLNDNVVEGINCLDIPAFSVQYHPEAAAGPHDAQYLFDRFINLMCSDKPINTDDIITVTDNVVVSALKDSSESEDNVTFGDDIIQDSVIVDSDNKLGCNFESNSSVRPIDGLKRFSDNVDDTLVLEQLNFSDSNSEWKLNGDNNA